MAPEIEKPGYKSWNILTKKLFYLTRGRTAVCGDWGGKLSFWNEKGSCALYATS